MRITRDTLLKIARETVQMQVQKNRRLICVYLTGSLLHEDPLIGGTTDIDLIFVHDSEPLVEREITRLSEEVHLDIAHYSQTVFHQPRHLRVNPWIGSFLCSNPIALHDSHHWFEFTQAAVCAQFQQPDYTYQRARTPADRSRQGWVSLRAGSLESETQAILEYLTVLENAANSVATFSGPPLTERRLLLQFPERAQAINRPGLAAGLVDLVSSEAVSADDWRSWQPAWNAALDAAGSLESAPARLNPLRKNYYTRAAASLWDSQPAAAVWILLRTWTLALDTLGADAPGLETWRAALAALELDPAHFSGRLDQLDTYLDSVEETLDQFAKEYGVETNI